MSVDEAIKVIREARRAVVDTDYGVEVFLSAKSSESDGPFRDLVVDAECALNSCQVELQDLIDKLEGMR